MPERAGPPGYHNMPRLILCSAARALDLLARIGWADASSRPMSTKRAQGRSVRAITPFGSRAKMRSQSAGRTRSTVPHRNFRVCRP